MNHKTFSVIKFWLLVIALGLASFLAFGENKKDAAPDQKIVFVVDVNRSMNTQDMLSGNKRLSRLQSAKYIIQKTIISEPQYSYGLVIFNAGADYLIPPTFDTWTFLSYLSWISTNLLSDWVKDFAQLSWLLTETSSTSYLLLSDFDGINQSNVKLPKSTSLLGLWTLAGDKVRYSNNIVYYDNGKSVFSARNDDLAKSFNLPYTPLANIADFSSKNILPNGFTLPVSQRIFLYTSLGVLIILVVLL